MANEKMRGAYRRYLKSEVKFLCGNNRECAYMSCSDKKWEAWNNCQKMMAELNGEGLRIISHSQYVFTCGFVFCKNGAEVFMYITPTYNRECEIKELTGRKV